MVASGSSQFISGRYFIEHAVLTLMHPHRAQGLLFLFCWQNHGVVFFRKTHEIPHLDTPLGIKLVLVRHKAPLRGMATRPWDPLLLPVTRDQPNRVRFKRCWWWDGWKAHLNRFTVYN